MHVSAWWKQVDLLFKRHLKPLNEVYRLFAGRFPAFSGAYKLRT